MPIIDPNKTVFISYRRKVSSFIARAIFLELRSQGFDVFMDVESIDNGTFDTIILEQIKARAHFLIILTPGTLNRCMQPGDWLRREIEHAMDEGRNIVPVMVNDFKFDKKVQKYLIGKLENLPRLSGLTLPHEYFDAAMERLRTRFLKQPVSGAIIALTNTNSQLIVDQKIERVASQGAPTQQELSAEEYFGRAYDKQEAETDDLETIISDYTEAIRLNPEYATAFNNRGVALRQQGEIEAAISDYNRVIQIDPKHTDAYLNRGYARVQTGEFDLAIEDYSKAIEIDPKYSKAYFNRGVAWRKRGDFEKAIVDYSQAIQLDSAFTPAYNNRAIARGLQGDRDGEIADYTEAIRINPEYAVGYGNRAESYFALRQYDLALVDFQKADELKPENAGTIAGLSITRHVLGNKEEAKELWLKLVKKDEKYKDAEWVGKTLNWREHLVEEARKLIAELG